MTRIILRLLNAPGIILLTAIGIALQTSIFAWNPISFFKPDLVLLVVIFCAFRRQLLEGGVLTLIAANMVEIHSAAPRGYYLIIYMSVYLGVRAATKVLVIPGMYSWMLLTLLASVCSKLEGIGLLYLLGASPGQWRYTAFLMFPSAVMAGLLGLLVYRGLEKFDELTFKNRNESSLDDELQVVGENY